MALRVRYRPNDLGDDGVVETIDGVDSIEIHEDNTCEMRKHVGPGKYRIIGYLHGARWDSVTLVGLVKR